MVVEKKQNTSASPLARALAWGVHAFTASGAVLGLLALQAAEARDWHGVMLWLFAALVVDAVDGPLARALRVKTVLPGFDGNILDLVVDYLTYVIVPVVMLCQGDFLPDGWRLTAAAAVLMSSLYHYGNVDIKTPDGYFEGFPAFWNVVVFYFYCFAPSRTVALGVVLAFCLLTLVPVKCVHPFRVKKFRGLTAPLTVVWAVLVGVALVRGQASPPWLAWVCLAPVGYLTLRSEERRVGKEC